jgi:hypothetical protein
MPTLTRRTCISALLVGLPTTAAIAKPNHVALQLADLLFVPIEGGGLQLLGQAIEAPTNPYGHVALVTAIERGRISVSHATGAPYEKGYVEEIDLSEFLANRRSLAIARPIVPESTRQKIASIGRNWANKVPFDQVYSWGGAAMYCTEFVYRAVWGGARVRLVDELDIVFGRTGLTVTTLIASRHIKRIWAGKTNDFWNGSRDARSANTYR